MSFRWSISVWENPLKPDKPLEFKVAGGAAAQTLGLLNALYLKRKFSRDFKIRYFPHSTGTYWPFAIDFLLSQHEISSAHAEIRGMKSDATLEVGKIIRDHPLESRYFSYERLLKWLRKLHLEFVLRKLVGEIALEARPGRLELVSARTLRVSGGFVPVFDLEVLKDIDARYRRGRDAKSPFSKNLDVENPYVAIHYRIGDKRAKFSHDKDFGGDGIFDPHCFKEILNQQDLLHMKIYVVSDEPTVAQSLLQEVGIDAHLFQDKHDIWIDLFRLSQAKILIGSWSQVSQLAAICVANNGGMSFLPSTTQVGTKIYWNIPKTQFFPPKFLDEDHPIYKPQFELESGAHKAYLQKSE